MRGTRRSRRARRGAGVAFRAGPGARLAAALAGILAMWLAPAFAAGAAPAATVRATACRGVSFPATVRTGGTTLALNGLGVRKATFLRINVYVAALYLPPSDSLRSTDTHPGAGAGGIDRRGEAGARADAPVSSDSQAIIASRGPWDLVLHFVRGVGARDIRDAFSDAFASEGGGRVPAPLAMRVAMLNGWVADMRAGETMTFLRIPERGVELDVGGRSMGVIPGDDFARALLAIWLGDHPPNPELKAGLLGGACR